MWAESCIGQAPIVNKIIIIKKKLLTSLCFSIFSSFFPQHPFHFSFFLSTVLQRFSRGRLLVDACIPGRNGKLILWSLRVSSNWMLFISWKEGSGKGSSLHVVAHFCSKHYSDENCLSALSLIKRNRKKTCCRRQLRCYSLEHELQLCIFI